MKKKYRLSIIITLFLIFAMCVSLIRGDMAQKSEYPVIGNFIKDETIYVNLGRDGSVEEINVVNRIETSGRGTYTDYGSYEYVASLTNTSLPDLEGDMISWMLDTSGNGFYYQGRLGDANLPFVFNITYELNGVETHPDEIAGKSGDIRIILNVYPDRNASQYFIETYLCSIQTGIDIEKSTDIRAYGSSSIITGRTMTLNYTILPGKSAEVEIALKTSDFSHDGFTFTCIPYNAGSVGGIDVDEIKSGFRRLGEGAEAVVSGTGILKSGLELLSASADSLSLSSEEIVKGIDGYSGNLEKYTEGISDLSKNAKDIARNLAAMAGGSNSLYDLFLQTEARAEILFSALEQGSADDHAEDIYMLREMMAVYKGQLLGFSEALLELSSGMSSFAEGISSLDSSGAVLVDSLSSILQGMGMFSEGLSRTASELRKLPEDIGRLIDAQQQLKGGISEAETSLNAFIPSGAHDTISFVSEKNKNIRSVQFIYKTREISRVIRDIPDTAYETKKKGFFEKLFDLFRK